MLACSFNSLSPEQHRWERRILRLLRLIILCASVTLTSLMGNHIQHVILVADIPGRRRHVTVHTFGE